MSGYTFSERHSQLDIKAATQSAERATDEIINTVFKIPKVFPLATLLDSRGRWHHLGPDNEFDMDASSLLKKRKRKRKRGWGYDGSYLQK
jgi:hypothetical protein